MQSDVLVVSNLNRSMNQVLNQVDAVASYKKLSPKGALHLHLLAEEMMGLMRSIGGASEGRFWIEDDSGVFKLHLAVVTRMSSQKRAVLTGTASSGKNDAARGLMGRLRDYFDRDADSDVADTSPMLSDGLYEYGGSAGMADMEWSLMRYRDEISLKRQRNEQDAIEAWDELEKSVVTHVADEIKVFIRGDRVEMVIYKRVQ